MQFYKQLYVHEDIDEGKIQKIKEKLEANKIQPTIYLITLAANPVNLLDIIPSYILLQPDYPKENLFILGFAKGNEGAMELVKNIVEEVYNATGTTNVREYILKMN